MLNENRESPKQKVGVSVITWMSGKLATKIGQKITSRRVNSAKWLNGAHFLHSGSFNIPSRSWYRPELSTVLLHSHHRHAVTTTTVLVWLWLSVDLQSEVAHSQLLALRYGTTCQLTSLLRHHSWSSESTSIHFCSCVHTLTLFCNP